MRPCRLHDQRRGQRAELTRNGRGSLLNSRERRDWRPERLRECSGDLILGGTPGLLAMNTWWPRVPISLYSYLFIFVTKHYSIITYFFETADSEKRERARPGSGERTDTR